MYFLCKLNVNSHETKHPTSDIS